MLKQFLALVLALVSVGACTQPHTDPFTNPSAASQAEYSEIVGALLEQHEFQGLPMPPPLPGDGPRAHVRLPVVLSTTTLKFCEFGPDERHPECDGDNSEYLDFVAGTSQIPATARKQLIDVNSESAVFPCGDGAWYRCVEKATIRDIFAGKGEWSEFYAQYPKTAGYLSISVPVLSHKGTKALTYVSHRCGGLCGAGTLFMLEKSQTGWRITCVEQIWIS